MDWIDLILDEVDETTARLLGKVPVAKYILTGL